MYLRNKTNEIKRIINKKNYFCLFLGFLLIILSFLEFIGIGSIPIYIGLILTQIHLLKNLIFNFYPPKYKILTQNMK